MLLQLEISVVFSLLLCTAAQHEEIRRRRTAAGDAIDGQSDKDAWRKDLLKYDFENRIWDISGITDNSVDGDSEIDGNADERYKAKKLENIAQNVTSNEGFARKLGNHDLLPVEYSKKVNDYFVDTQWEYGTTEGTSQSVTTNQHVTRPIFDFPSIDPITNAESKVSLYELKHQQSHLKESIHPENWETSSFAQFTRRPNNFPVKEQDSYLPQTSDLKQRPGTLFHQPGSYNKYTKGAYIEHETNQPTNSRRYKTQRNQHNFTPKQHYSSSGQSSSYPNQYNKPVRYQHNTFNLPRNSYRKHNFGHTKHKTRVKQNNGAHQKQNIGSYEKQKKPPHQKQNIGSYEKQKKTPHLKPNSVPQQEAKSKNLVIHYHDFKGGHPRPSYSHRHRQKRPYRHPPIRGGSGNVSLFSRLLTPLLVVGGILLIGTLAGLGYLIWLTPPTIVTYSKRQRGEVGADLLAAPFELSQLTELAAQLSQVLAEAELVALKLSSGGELQAERWRRCQPLQLCRALVEGAVIHHQPVWSRYIRAAPWLWLFGLDPKTAARLQELARRPGFRSCRPFFKPCGKS